MEMTNDDIKKFSHDQFVRTAMADLRVARDFFRKHLPNDLLQLTDLSQLKLEPRSYVNDIRKESIVDILFKTSISGREGYLYLLLEHQSTADPLMAFRMMKYVFNIIERHLKITHKTSIPLIYPMVIYHGERPYPYSTDIKKLVDAPADWVDQYFLKPFHLIDLNLMNEKEPDLKDHHWAGIMEWALKYIYARDIMAFMNNIVEIMHEIALAGGDDYVFTVLQYVLIRGGLTDESEFLNLINTRISPEIGGGMITLADRLIAKGEAKGWQEGRQEGRQEGKEAGKAERNIEIALSLLKEGVDQKLITKITGLSMDKLNQMQTRLEKSCS